MRILALNKHEKSNNALKTKSAKNVITLPKTISAKQPSVYETGGMGIAFRALMPKKGGLVIGDNLRKLMNQIDSVKARIKVLKEMKPGEKPQSISNAESTVYRYEYWRDNGSRIRSNAEAAAKKAEKAARDAHSGWANFWNDYPEKAYNKKWKEEYTDQWYSYYSVGNSEYEIAKANVQSYNQVKNANEAARISEISSLERELEALEANINLNSIRDAVNEAMGQQGGLEDRIAGYEQLKSEIKRSFVSPLIESVKAGNNNVHVPPAVMLYGATGCGKTSILNAIKAQVKGYADVVDISAHEDKNILSRLNTMLSSARAHYLETFDKNGRGERTIILMNEAEAYLATNPEDMGVSGMFFDPSDIKKMELYNKTYNCAGNVNILKSKLDYISKLPTADCPHGCAATIFITSNYPHLIHRDLLSRDGEFGKMLTYAVRPAKDEDLKAVIQYYFTKMSNLVEQIKYFAKQEDCDSLIDSIVGLSDNVKDLLKVKAHNKTINNLVIDPTLSGIKNLDRFIQGNNPTIEDGAFSNARLENIIKEAYLHYMENPAVPFERHFLNTKGGRRDISPEAYRQFEGICDMVESPEKYRDSLAGIGDGLRDLVNRYRDGEDISVEDFDKARLTLDDLKKRYRELDRKAELSDTEAKVKEQLGKFLISIRNIKIPDLF